MKAWRNVQAVWRKLKEIFSLSLSFFLVVSRISSQCDVFCHAISFLFVFAAFIYKPELNICCCNILHIKYVRLLFIFHFSLLRKEQMPNGKLLSQWLVHVQFSLNEINTHIHTQQDRHERHINYVHNILFFAHTRVTHTHTQTKSARTHKFS